MPYIAVDLPVIEGLAAQTARASGVDENHILGGLVRLWHRCWCESADHFTAAQLRGVFGPEGLEAVLAALVDFGFLETQGDAYRVRGASRYLRLKESRRMGARRTNEARALERRSKSARKGDALERPLSDALSPSTEHRAPSTEPSKPAPATRTPRESDEVCAVFLEVTGQKYLWQGAKDGVAFAKLRKQFELSEILARWRKALGLVGWKQAASVAQLAAKWNDLAVSDADVRKGYLDGIRGSGENTARVVHGGKT